MTGAYWSVDYTVIISVKQLQPRLSGNLNRGWGPLFPLVDLQWLNLQAPTILAKIEIRLLFLFHFTFYVDFKPRFHVCRKVVAVVRPINCH